MKEGKRIKIRNRKVKKEQNKIRKEKENGEHRVRNTDK
jgi:hypothetical protein